eukprot:scaffold8104_cov62-Phaeocystis_antarctica.AAC.1
MSSDDGRCLYSRMGGIDTEKKLLEHNVGGGHQKITFVGGPDHVMKLSKWHKSPKGRGYATLGVGWPNPSTDTGYWYLVFAAPCPNSKWQVPSQRIPAIPRHPTPIMNVAGYGVAGLVSRNTPRPVSASWAGVAAVAKEVANVSAAGQKEIYRDDGVDLWKETARKYSFLGGGLGPAGKLGPAKKYFLESVLPC